MDAGAKAGDEAALEGAGAFEEEEARIGGEDTEEDGRVAIVFEVRVAFGGYDSFDTGEERDQVVAAGEAEVVEEGLFEVVGVDVADVDGLEESFVRGGDGFWWMESGLVKGLGRGVEEMGSWKGRGMADLL